MFRERRHARAPAERERKRPERGPVRGFPGVGGAS